VEPYNWAAFLRQHLDSVAKPAPLEGLRRGGYKLVYTDTPSDYLKGSDDQRKRVNLLFSIGIEIDDKDKQGSIRQVIWDSPAFKAKLTEDAQILAVNGAAYSADILKDAIRSAHSAKSPIELIIKTGDRFMVANVDYHDGLRYPHLEREPSEPARLDDIVAARP
jgi:predicted metalloprotease with PDZ domain